MNIHSETSLKIDNKRSLNESNSNKNNTNINTQNTTLKEKSNNDEIKMKIFVKKILLIKIFQILIQKLNKP